jgi:hypothetical protein
MGHLADAVLTEQCPAHHATLGKLVVRQLQAVEGQSDLVAIRYCVRSDGRLVDRRGVPVGLKRTRDGRPDVLVCPCDPVAAVLRAPLLDQLAHRVGLEVFEVAAPHDCGLARVDAPNEGEPADRLEKAMPQLAMSGR